MKFSGQVYYCKNLVLISSRWSCRWTLLKKSHKWQTHLLNIELCYIGRRGGGRAASAPGRPHSGERAQRSPSHSLTRGHAPHHPPQHQIDHRSVSQADARQPFQQPYASKSPQSSFRKSTPRSPGGSEIPQNRMNVSFGNTGPRGQAPPQVSQHQQRSYKTSLGHQSMIWSF